MSYAAEGIDQRAEVLQGAVDGLTYYTKALGASMAPSGIVGVNVTVYDSSGNVLVARSTTGVTVLSAGMTYSRTWELATFPIDEDYKLIWEWTSGGVAYADSQFFDVVKNKLLCLIDESDLLEHLPDLTSHLLAIGETNPTKFIKRAWSEMLDRIRTGHNRPSLILEKMRLINPATHLSVAKCCWALMKETDDLWHTRFKEHMKHYNELFAGLGDLKYDIDEDNAAGVNETKRVNRRSFSV